MASVEVKPVSTSKDLNHFIKFPWKIYKDDPYWVAPLLMDRRKLVDRKNNPFYKHADVEFFLAYKNNEIVGRIAAIINHNHNKEHKDKIGFFGFFESINDQQVADVLIRTSKEWLKARGMTGMRGPANPSVNDEYGMLIDGFDKQPVILMPYNPPYYNSLIEKAGVPKIKDLYAYHVSKERSLNERLTNIASRVAQREGLKFRSIDMKNFDKEVDAIKQLYNRAWQYNWGAVQMTNEEFDYLAKDLKQIIVPELVIIAEFNGEPIGFSLSIPDLNIALKHNKNGYLLPGIFRLFWHKKKINWVRVLVLGVVPERLKTGAASVLFYETAKRCTENGYPDGEAGWVLEDNTMMNRAAEFLNAERSKTYRLYETSL
ncbi:MAG: hypothetical protein HZB59_10195 [Ignavibacteriales bacterium]|nr:hypothetical protein [Ignavibacteriales bacterium]